MFHALLIFALLAAPAVHATLSIDTPVFTQCKNVDITWNDAQGLASIAVVNAADPCGDALVDLNALSGVSLSWKVALKAGQSVELWIGDASGDESWSGTITVQDSDDSSCLSTSNNSSSSSSTPSAESTGSGSSSIPSETLSLGIDATPTSASAGSSSSGLGGIVGGVGNAGANPLGLGKNGALGIHQASTLVMVLGVAAAIVTASL